MKSAKVTAREVLDVLREKHFDGNAWAFLREVANGTGTNAGRWADALAVSCWPSRGLFFAGIEVKTARGDWLRELKSAEKSSAVQRYCSYWWIATTPDVIKDGELPPTWGHIEVAGKSRKVLAQAPRLEPEAPTMDFVASVFRNCGAQADGAYQAAYQKGRADALKSVSPERVRDLEMEVATLAPRAANAERLMQHLRDTVHDFERKTGLSINAYSDAQTIARLRAARALEGVDLSRMANVLRNAAEGLANANTELNAAQHEEGATL